MKLTEVNNSSCTSSLRGGAARKAAKRMQRVDLAKIISGLFAKRGNVRPFQIAFFSRLLKNELGDACNMRMIGPLERSMSRSSPAILKQMLINGFQVIAVKTPLNGFLKKLKTTPRDEGCLSFVQFVFISDAEFVLQNTTFEIKLMVLPLVFCHA